MIFKTTGARARNRPLTRGMDLIVAGVQVHVKLDGRNRVLINHHNLPGVNAKALKLSKREEDVRSALQSV